LFGLAFVSLAARALRHSSEPARHWAGSLSTVGFLPSHPAGELRRFGTNLL